MDIKHHYIEKGNGFPLILLHGNGEDCSYFEHQMEPLSEHFRVIAIDTRGHGQTPRGTAPFNIRLIAQSIPGAQLSIIPGNHFIANKNPETFNQAVLEFLL
jgi:pimeloyl-ACP methyl ester carboxylesterase